jgi:hypothetical protein
VLTGSISGVGVSVGDGNGVSVAVGVEVAVTVAYGETMMADVDVRVIGSSLGISVCTACMTVVVNSGDIVLTD